MALAGKDVGAGAGRGVEFWNTVAGLGEALVAANVVPMGAVWGAGAAVVTTPEGALLLTREICCPPWIFCWRFVWKVPVFWLKESWLWKELGAEFLFCSKVREGLLRVKPSSSASKSNVP